MLLSVSEVLETDAVLLGQPRVVAGRAGLAAEVRWARVSELTDIAGMLRGGELVLTTGVMLPDSPAGLTSYVDALADVGADGLIVELGRRYPGRIPAPLVHAANRSNSAVAAAAHLSRPSFHDRLRRVEWVLGVDLDQVESCLAPHVALLTLDAVRR